MNDFLWKCLNSGMSQRRAARNLNLSRTTVVRKFLFLHSQNRLRLETFNLGFPLATEVEIDDLITFEHTKCKPLSVIMMVEAKSRRILGFEVATMPANGRLAAIARKKYGPRRDSRSRARKLLLQRMKHLVSTNVLIKSDENPHYPIDIKRAFPGATHKVFKGKVGSDTGQGELKKIRFDPIFSINHTFAKLRADINRLIRKTWCTTKKRERLAAHLTIYAVYHNLHL